MTGLNKQVCAVVSCTARVPKAGWRGEAAPTAGCLRSPSRRQGEGGSTQGGGHGAQAFTLGPRKTLHEVRVKKFCEGRGGTQGTGTSPTKCCEGQLLRQGTAVVQWEEPRAGVKTHFCLLVSV